MRIGHSYLSLVSLPGFLGRFPDAIADFISFGYVDHIGRRPIWREKPSQTSGAWGSFGRRHHSAQCLRKSRSLRNICTPILPVGVLRWCSRSRTRLTPSTSMSLPTSKFNLEGIFFPTLFMGEYDDKTFPPFLCCGKDLQLRMLCASGRHAEHDQAETQHLHPPQRPPPLFWGIPLNISFPL